jgi:ATP-dependent DNA helicase RecQ
MVAYHDLSSQWTDQNLEDELKKHFGYNTFRAFQTEIIRSLMRKEDVLAILPTGAGKSLCYQLPALLQGGTAIVISPLISLMQDQVVSLSKNGIAAAFLNSSLSSQEIRSVLQNLAAYKLIYVAPERLVEPQFLERIKEIPISFFVIDEAHCISQWGHSFRVEYRKLSMLKQTFPSCPIIAVTATATKDVEKDIQVQLAMVQPRVIAGSFDRENLTIRVHSKNQRENQLQAFLKQHENESGIIYASTRKGVENTYELLQQAGHTVGRYHAGLSDQERSSSQNAFLHDQVTLMVATVAFGMGVHKPDIRFVVHMDMPRTIEQYSQEIGRAGRDGLPAECLMFYSAQDLFVYNSFLTDLEDLAIRQQMKAKMQSMYRLCSSMNCRRQVLLNYFGESYPKASCGTCDICLEDVEQMDGSIIAQKLLSCVYRVRQNLGVRMIIDIMRGSKSRALLERGFDQVSTYGLLKEMPEQEVRFYIESLIHLGLLTQTDGEYPVLKWTEGSLAVVRGQQQVYFKKRVFKETKEERTAFRSKESSALHYDEAIFQSLRGLRLQIAREEQVPPFVVFSDRALQEMALYAPQNEQEFGKINGVGPIKWVKYGEKFLELIRSYPKPASTPKMVPPASTAQMGKSRQETVTLFKQGRSVEEMMEKRQLTRGTLITHLAEAIQEGATLDISSILSTEKKAEIEAVIAQVGGERLSPIKALLPQVSFDEIRLVVALCQVEHLSDTSPQS